jgi:hypothetical protein
MRSRGSTPGIKSGLKTDVVRGIDGVIVTILAVGKLTRSNNILNLTLTLFQRHYIRGVHYKIMLHIA